MEEVTYELLLSLLLRHRMILSHKPVQELTRESQYDLDQFLAKVVETYHPRPV